MRTLFFQCRACFEILSSVMITRRVMFAIILARRRYTLTSGSRSSRFRHSLFAGLIAVVPLLVTVFVLVWLAQLIEGLMAPLLSWVLGQSVPGLGFVSALVVVVTVGTIATTVVGSRILSLGERLLTRIPLFKDIYVPVKQLVAAFSPQNESGFKQVVLATHPKAGNLCLGFLTREFEMPDSAGQAVSWAAVYVPTNHLWLGDVYCFLRKDLLFPELTVEEGIRIVLTGGTSFPASVRLKTN